MQSYSPIFKNVEMKPVSKGIASSEKDGLAGADLYSFHHYYGPFRHPIQPSLFLADPALPDLLGRRLDCYQSLTRRLLPGEATLPGYSVLEASSS